MVVDSKRNSKFFVQLAAGKIWEKAPVELSIVEKRIHLCPPQKPPVPLCANLSGLKAPFIDVKISNPHETSKVQTC
jgi:hypothetical protein